MAQRASQRTSVTTTAGGRVDRLAALARASVRRPDFTQGTALSAIARVLWGGSAGLLVWIGAIHWDLWHLGYKFIRIDGPLFLADAIVAVLLAVLLLAWPRPVVGLVSAAFVAATIAALLISLWIGLFGFHESISASFVVEALWLESIAVMALVAWSVIAMTAVPRDR